MVFTGTLVAPQVELDMKLEAASKEFNLAPKVLEFVQMAADLCSPDAVHICDGSEKENKQLLNLLMKQGTLRPLDPVLRPGCYAAFTDPDDVARSEKDTFICCRSKEQAGPTNNWVDPDVKMEELKILFSGCMRGRTMYVIPFSMGPYGSELSKIGIQITDSAYVVVSMKIMSRMGAKALETLGNGDFVRAMHSVGVPMDDSFVAELQSGNTKSTRLSWPCNIKQRNVCHFPETNEIWSFGSGYGGNSLLGKKCFALRIASTMGQKEGWLAEHMLIVGITNPQGVKKYIAAAFPSACGKTNLAMMQPSLPGWKVETVGDDIAWMKPGKDGKLYAINPEFGFFGVAPGTSYKTNPTAMKTCESNTLFTNVGVTEHGDVYWEGMDLPECKITDWKGNEDWKPTYKANGKIDEKIKPCAQPNSRFTTPISQCPALDPLWNSPEGVPIDAIIFGGRRNDTVPLVFEAFNWQHGTFLGSVMRSQATNASDQVGLVNDPMAIKAFCGYNIKDYFAHWLSLGEKYGASMPKIFHVNWFRLDSEGRFMWPGFGDNIRVIDWMMKRIEGTVDAVQTPIGFVPKEDGLNLSGLNMDSRTVNELLRVDPLEWKVEAAQIDQYYSKTLVNDSHNTPMPMSLLDELDRLKAMLATQ